MKTLPAVERREFQRRTDALHTQRDLRRDTRLDPPISIHTAVRMGVQLEESTGRRMDSAWLLALPVEVAVAQMKAEAADIAAMRTAALARVPYLPVVEIDSDAVHRKAAA